MGARKPAVDGLFESDAGGAIYLLSSHCQDCGAHSFPSRESCPECLSERVKIERAGPRGQIFAYTIVHETFGRGSLPPPYGVALIDFENGLRARGLIHPDFNNPEIGQEVAMTEIVLESEEDSDLTTYAFIPAGDNNA